MTARLSQNSEAAAETRFARWRPLPARLLVALLALLIAYGVGVALTAKPLATGVATSPADSDPALYRAIAERVASGESYYSAAVKEQRTRGYPLRPFVTVRLPTLAWLTAALGTSGAALLYRAIALGTLLALGFRLRASAFLRAEWIAGLGIAAFATALLAGEGLWLWHEAWAGMLIALSLAGRSSRHWAASVLLGFAAAFIRELALPYLCVMAFCAWRERRWLELSAWVAAIVGVALVLAGHAFALGGLITDADAASPGWSAAGGWGFVLMLTRRCTALALAPLEGVAVLLPLSVLGWSAWKSRTGDRALLLVAGYLSAFMLIGRPDNFYWGLLIAPLLLSGLAFAPRGLRDLLRAARLT